MNSVLKAMWHLVFALTGLDISFDAKYEDLSLYCIELRASLEKAQEMLAERHFTPREVAPGETRLQILGADFGRVQTVGAYKEVAIQVPVEPLGDGPGDRLAHLFLPVTTEAARWPGVDIDGFPKFIAQIDFAKNEERVSCRLAADEELILEFAMDDKLGAQKQERWEFYGLRKGRTVRTAFDLEGLVWEEEAPGDATLVLGQHPIGQTLRTLLLSDDVVRTLIGHDIGGAIRKPVRL